MDDDLLPLVEVASSHPGVHLMGEYTMLTAVGYVHG